MTHSIELIILRERWTGTGGRQYVGNGLAVQDITDRRPTSPGTRVSIFFLSSNKLSRYLMDGQPDYKECLKDLEIALGTLQYLSLHACSYSDEKSKLEETCKRLVEHITELRSFVASFKSMNGCSVRRVD